MSKQPANDLGISNTRGVWQRVWASVVAKPGERRLAAPPMVTLELAERAFAEQRYSDAAAAFKVLAPQGHSLAHWRLGQCYESGAGVLPNPLAAVRAYEAAAAAGMLEAQARLGEIYLTGLSAPATGNVTEIATAPSGGGSHLFQKLAANDTSVKPDPIRSAHWNQLAAERDDWAAAARLGHQCASGLGVELDPTQAEHWFRRAANGHHVAGQLGLGLLLSGHYGAEPDIDAALPWLELACAQGHVLARLTLALILMEAPVETRDHARITKLLSQAARAGQIDAMFAFGERYRTGDGVACDLALAETWLRRAAVKGSVKARVSLVRLLSELSEPDLHQAAALCREAAEADDAEAQYLLGVFCLEGRGVPIDAHEAAVWFKKAAAQHVIGAFERLGALYSEGLGVPQDYAQAAVWFQRAADAGDREAAMQLGTLQLQGLGLAKDASTGLLAYQQAAALGSAEAALQLGITAASGVNGAIDFAQAAHWYQTAADRQLPEAAYNLAQLYLQGLGVPQDTAQASHWLTVAARQSYLPALIVLYQQALACESEKDPLAKALPWLVRAAELGDATAAERLIKLLEEPKRVSSEGLIKALEKIAVKGNDIAQLAVGDLYAEGIFVKANAPLAQRWYEEAAAKGNVTALERLAQGATKPSPPTTSQETASDVARFS